jgi:DNA end-binding protein Ku
MAARSIWKGVIQFGGASVPVKLYSAVQDRSIHFRLLHEKDKVPVRQQMVDPTTGEPVDTTEARKAYPITRNRFVILDDEDFEGLEPEESRDIEVTRFVDPAEIDHRWYERAYYLGPDGGSGPYFALAEALERQGKEGVARWTMRKKSYVGALRAREGYLVLITLRHADEVIVAEDLPAPEGRPLNKREVEMAAQLVEALSGEFDPDEFRDDYRARVMELVETKSRGGKVKVRKFRPRKETDESLDDVLAASLKSLKKKGA